MLEIIVLGGALRAAERFNQKEVERSFSAVFQTHGSPSFIYKVDQRLEGAWAGSTSPATMAT